MLGRHFGKVITAIVTLLGVGGYLTAKAEEAIANEAATRKSQSEAILRSEGIPINPYLPVIETQVEVKARTVQEIAERAMSLMIVHTQAGTPDRGEANKLIARYGLQDALTPEERAFVADDKPSDKERSKFSWRIEAAWVLLWALGYADGLEKPVEVCDVSQTIKLLATRTRVEFLADAKPRAMSDVLDRADRIYRYHWAARDAQLNGRPVPSNLNYDVIMERHHALNWLIRYSNAEWDDVTTDT